MNWMIQELLKELQELDEAKELSEDDEAMIDVLLQELELEIAFPVRDGRIEILQKWKEMNPLWTPICQLKVSARTMGPAA